MSPHLTPLLLVLPSCQETTADTLEILLTLRLTWNTSRLATVVSSSSQSDTG
eukprot:m.40557 g.40557  ORF g.40557 m.40557 type:complete len:52 (-) comp14828_c0_seq1:70-225(-)